VLSADGVPANLALVQQAGASDLEQIAFSQFFGRDFNGACRALPMDLGAIEVP